MENRYTELFRNTNIPSIEGCFAKIEICVLQKDNTSGKTLAQIKFKNLQNNEISSCTIQIKAYDKDGKEIEGIDEYQYSNLNANKEEYFGSRVPLYLPNDNTASFAPIIKSIVCSNGAKWDEANKPIEDEENITNENNKFFEIDATPVIVTEAAPKQEQSNIAIVENITNSNKDEKTCPKCGSIRKDKYKFCNKCGYSFVDVKEPEKIQEQTVSEAKEKTKAVKSKKKGLVGKIILGVCIVVLIVFGVIYADKVKQANEKSEKLIAYISPTQKSYNSFTKLYGELSDFELSIVKSKVANALIEIIKEHPITFNSSYFDYDQLKNYHIYYSFLKYIGFSDSEYNTNAYEYCEKVEKAYEYMVNNSIEDKAYLVGMHKNSSLNPYKDLNECGEYINDALGFITFSYQAYYVLEADLAQINYTTPVISRYKNSSNSEISKFVKTCEALDKNMTSAIKCTNTSSMFKNVKNALTNLIELNNTLSAWLNQLKYLAEKLPTDSVK